MDLTSWLIVGGLTVFAIYQVIEMTIRARHNRKERREVFEEIAVARGICPHCDGTLDEAHVCGTCGEDCTPIANRGMSRAAPL